MSESSSDFAQHLQKFDFDSFPNAGSRREALAAARALVTRLETPMDTFSHMSHEIPALYAALKVGMLLNVFETLSQDNGSAKSASQLAGNADPALVVRCLRHLASMNIIGEAGPDLFVPTRHSSALLNPAVSATIDYFRDITSKTFTSLPAFLEHTHFKNPVYAAAGNWQYLLGRDVSYFQWMAENPDKSKNFTNIMIGYNAQWDSWCEVYPGHELLDNANDGDVLIVDIGGGSGHDLARFLQKYPQSAGRLIGQDVPQVIEVAKTRVPNGIRVESHDFFQSQPVHNARAYFLHRVLHDWPDDKAREILANIKPAMKPGYSRLLITDIVIPLMHAKPYLTTMDLAMAAMFSSKERTEDDWVTLLKSAGFKIKKIWESPAASDAVIEAEPA